MDKKTQTTHTHTHVKNNEGTTVSTSATKCVKTMQTDFLRNGKIRNKNIKQKCLCNKKQEL